jgi:hypothetical protein
LALLSKDGLMTKVMYFFATLWCCTRKAHAAEVGVAVAANFTAPMQKIALAFEQSTGHKAVLSFGSTDMFYAQIRNGAPFQVLLSADDETPIKLEKDGLGVAGKGFTYATRKTGSVERAVGRGRAQGAVLRSGRFEWRGIANPKLAPYGATTLKTITQLGFVALSPLSVDGKIAQGSANDERPLSIELISPRPALTGSVCGSRETGSPPPRPDWALVGPGLPPWTWRQNGRCRP